MPVIAVIGAQWGDEGKGKIVDLLAMRAQVVARSQGGANAGHTIRRGDGKIVLHLLPSGVLSPTAQCLIGPGVVVDVDELIEELAMLGGGYGLWAGCAAGDTGAAMVFKVG